MGSIQAPQARDRPGPAGARSRCVPRRGAARPCAAALLALAGAASATVAGAQTAAPDGSYLRIESVRLARDRWALYLDGTIEPGADQRLARFVAQQGLGPAEVYIDSPGGSLLAAMAIGRLLRERGDRTDVARRSDDPRRPTAGACYSACPFAYAGGVRRTLRDGSVLGVHRARNRVPVPDDDAFDRRVRDDTTAYLREMGVSPALSDLMLEVPAGGMRVLGPEELVELGLVTHRPPRRR